MASLAEKEGFKGKVQTIYLDPPYGIKFGSNWQVSTRKRDVKDGKAEDATRQPEQIKAFRDTWELGIHSYLAYLRDRLTVARELLTESGSIFVQIGDENVHLVRCVMDEVFGSENFVSQIPFATTFGAGSFAGGTKVLASVTNYIVWYARTLEATKYRQLYLERELGGSGAAKYSTLERPDGTRIPTASLTEEQVTEGRLLRYDNLTSQTTRVGRTTIFPVTVDGTSVTPRTGGWKTNREGMDRLVTAGRVVPTGSSLSYLRYFDDFPAFPITNQWPDIGGVQSREDPKVYVVQTGTRAVERCILMATDPGDLVLDPTCGGGTTALVAEQRGRRWITVDTSRVALALARTRLMGARFPYYQLTDSPEGAKREAELTGVSPTTSAFSGDVRKGFVYKRVPHITLKSIANNPDIREGMSREEIDAAIRRHADTELLYDQPYEDTSRIRVTGPFTVESLSPHRLLSGGDGDGSGPVGEAPLARAATSDAADFVTIILENLRKAGVQNTFRGERLVFERIEPYAGTYVQAIGEYSDAAGKTLRAAISIGPEYGTVDSTWVKEAAKEARQGEGFPMLVVCSFAFGPYVGEEARQWGNLTILITRMNPDLAMDTADQKLLKSTGAGNLFMVFGEPDLELRTFADGKLQVELRGLDVYDPTTGEIRSDTTDEIACWFIDTDYNEESFFVRHAYFTGADEPYKKLQRALKAEIDEEAWASLYSTVSRPFEAPPTGKIAVKVINHYGDEVLKVYECTS
jgi:adenine-specific DNA-methyltransferase